MQFTVNLDIFSEAVSFPVAMLPARVSQPILGGVLLEAVGDKVTFSIFNYEVSAKTEVNAVITEPGRVLVPGKILANIAKKLTHNEVELTLHEDKVEVRSGSAIFNLPSMPIAEYPEIPNIDNVSGEVRGSDFVSAVSRVFPAASNEDVTPVLCGINFEISGNTLVLTATDRYRIATCGIDWQPLNGQEDTKFLVPAKVVYEVSKQLAHAKTVQLVIKNEGNRQLIGFIGDNKIITTQLISGVFPPVHKYFENTTEHYAVVNSEELKQAINLVAVVLDGDTPVKFEFSENKVVLNGSGSEATRASDSVEAHLVGADTVVGLKPSYFKDGVNGAQSEFIRISFFESNRPERPGAVLVTGQHSKDDVSEKSFRYLQQPNLLMK